MRLLILANKKSSYTLSLQNVSLSVVETVICRQNSRLYGVILKILYVLCIYLFIYFSIFM